MVYEKEEKKEKFEEVYEYEFEEDDCTIKKSITANEQDIRDAVEYILNNKINESKIDEALNGYFDPEEIAGLSREELKRKVIKEADVEQLTCGFSWELDDYFKDIAETDGEIIEEDGWGDDRKELTSYYYSHC